VSDIPAACPKCGSTEIRVQMLAWVLWRDGEMDGLIIGDGEIEPANEGIIRCDDDACDWQLPEKLP
jgi:hypothetical protein